MSILRPHNLVLWCMISLDLVSYVSLYRHVSATVVAAHRALVSAAGNCLRQMTINHSHATYRF